MKMFKNRFPRFYIFAIIKLTEVNDPHLKLKETFTIFMHLISQNPSITAKFIISFRHSKQNTGIQ